MNDTSRLEVGPPAAPTTVFTAGDDGYHTFRIPAVVRTRSGALVAFAEGRVAGAGDDGDIDLISRRSVDGGRTWDSLSVVWDGGETGAGKAGNPVPVVDRSSGDIVLLVTRTAGHGTSADIRSGKATPADGRRAFALRSRDDGRTWGPAREITSEVKRSGWRHFVFGPGHAVQLERGKHAGRILAAGDHSVAPPTGSHETGTEPRFYGTHIAYSDDGGHTWVLGAVDEDHDDSVNGDESQLVELGDGTIYQGTRDQHGPTPHRRARAISSDGGATYAGPLEPEPELLTPVVQGSVLGVDDVVLFSAPFDPDDTGTRKNLTIWRSVDGTITWEAMFCLHPGPSGYSDLVQAGDDEIGVLYEAGDASGTYRRIDYAPIHKARLLWTSIHTPPVRS